MSYSFPPSVTPQEVKEKLDRQDPVVLLDVREHAELAIVRLPNVLHIPMGEIPTRLNELKAHPDSEIVVLCHLGGRSMQVASYLMSQGVANVKNLDGGIDAWASEVDPSLPRY
ncbi:MAG: rhodanese-like domain-containing protein [bacterium]|jgi:rhodanese-related sulfurtransferase|nr:rhodanese-like domain-containing protein [bacterium]